MFAIVQLSDIHVGGPGDGILDRVQCMCSAIEQAASLSQHLIIICPGDVAFSGTTEQYDAAEQFFTQISKELKTRLSGEFLGVVCVPGNHDCNFGLQSDVRQMFLSTGAKNLDQLSMQGDVVRHCLSVQKEFWEFAAKVTVSPSAPTLFHCIELSVGETRLCINGYNTAWVSTLAEKPGQLFFPLQAITTRSSNGADLTISVFHHPYNWLEPNNSLRFKATIEGSSDLILTGHEHSPDQYVKSRPTGSPSHYLEAPALQSEAGSAFNVILVEPTVTEYAVCTCIWNGSHYVVSRASTPYVFIRNAATHRGRIPLNDEFFRLIDDPGTGFTHPMTESLTLSDLFVYPDLKRAPLEALSHSSSETIKSSDVHGFIRDEPTILITGPDKSGKTTIAKKLYCDLNPTHVMLLLNGDQIKTGKAVEGEPLKALIERSFMNQYDVTGPEPFWSLERARRALILDDFNHAQLNARGQTKLLENLERIFGKIVCLADETVKLEQLTGDERSYHPFRAYTRLEIKEFGHYLRAKLISKWTRIGRDLSADERKIQHEISTAEKTVNALIGRNVLPAYPIIVLTILQGVEATKINHSTSGSYGQVYELLITGALARIITKPSDLDTRYTYLSKVAYFLFTASRKTLTLDDFNAINSAYEEEYGIQIETSTTIEELLTAGVFRVVSGVYEFKYP